ncbi:enoyl-CoA hydratase-related protein [Streptomyces sp. NBC_01527]|uniref:enoyl-CoA hydratase-related protein n=1 Tax=Streptomyces sp. NBC_01527 TaxID=2903894 RepID=UPI00386D1341
MNTEHEASASVLHERRGGVLTITLNRPARKNAVDHEVAARLASVSDRLDAGPELSAGVLTGTGGVFSRPSPGRRPTPRSSDQP